MPPIPPGGIAGSGNSRFAARDVDHFPIAFGDVGEES
jgi:hypothetical protein